ncbi:MAG TPA: hypothetical protein VK838_00855 [Candidatus Limnocylindrales bacterium]|nr:hypothetical protein [Candidatus Limnocylindrales bacterium]
MRLLTLRRTVLVWLLAGMLAACAPDASPSVGGSTILADVATYQFVVNRPERMLLALFSGDNRWLSFGEVQMSFSYAGDGTGSPVPEVSMPDAVGRFLPIPGTPTAGAEAPTLTFPADGRGVYTAQLTFPRVGFWRVLARGETSEGQAFAAEAALQVVAHPSVLSVGDEAPRSDNPLAGDPDIPPSAVDSRASADDPIPDPELHSTSIADAIAAGHPTLIVFSTPVYCISRFCGPVTDLVAELAGEYGDRADFIHVEIYRDFIAGEINPSATEWLAAPDGSFREPWIFLVGADGRIAGSWDTMVTRQELEPMLAALPPR